MEPPCKQLYTIETLHHRPSLYYSGICFPLRPPDRKKGESGGDFLLQRYLVQQHPSSSLHSHLFHFHDLPINQKCDKIWRDISSFFSLESFPYLAWLRLRLRLGFTMKFKQVKTGLGRDSSGLDWAEQMFCDGDESYFHTVATHNGIISKPFWSQSFATVFVPWRCLSLVSSLYQANRSNTIN